MFVDYLCCISPFTIEKEKTVTYFIHSKAVRVVTESHDTSFFLVSSLHIIHAFLGHMYSFESFTCIVQLLFPFGVSFSPHTKKTFLSQCVIQGKQKLVFSSYINCARKEKFCK